MYTNTNWNVVNLFKDRAERIDSTQRFRLKTYNITMQEIAKVRYGTHCKYNTNYHLVWIPKTRMSILDDPFKKDLLSWIPKICREHYWHPLALEIMPNHIHFFVSAHPKWAPMRIVQKIKQETSKQLRAKYSIIRQTRKTNDFWATGYYCGTAGHVSAKQVARYILEQTKRLKDQFKLFDLQPFEYDIDNPEKEMPRDQTTLAAYGVGGFNSAL